MAHDRPVRRDSVVVQRDGVTVTCAIGVAPGSEARALAEQVDRDRSATLDPRELSSLVRFLAERAGRHAQLTVDGREVALSTGDVVEVELPPTVDGAEARGLSLAVRRRASVRLDDRPHRLLFADRAPDARLTVAVEVRADGVRLAEMPRAPVVWEGHPLAIATSPR
jgi:hypothetical protein